MISRALWRPLPITTLTLRQFSSGRSVWLVVIFSFFPCLFASIYTFGVRENPNDWTFYYVNELYRGLVVATLLPVITQVLATGAFGQEIEDKTLYYLTLKPVSRWRIVLEKFLGVMLLAIPLQLLGLTAAWAIVFHTDLGSHNAANALTAVLPSALMGILAYGAIFMFVGLWLKRALLAGIFYVILWESFLGRFIDGLKTISVRQYTESIVVDLVDDPDITLKGAFSVPVSVAVLVIVTVIALALASRRLKRLNMV